MFQFDFGKKIAGIPNASNFRSKILRKEIDAISWSFWEEHCLECAQPDCYKTCPLYVRRPDQNCARFENGILEDNRFEGLLGFGATINFRKWAKLQTRIGNSTLSPEKVLRYGKIDAFLSRAVVTLDRCISPISHSKYFSLQRYYQKIRRSLHEGSINKHRDANLPSYDAFIVEIWNQSKTNFAIILEAVHSNAVIYRHRLDLNFGRNVFTIPWKEITENSGKSPSGWMLHPENDKEVEVTFTFLDAVRFSKSNCKKSTKTDRHASKVKCVVWDLDNTLWHGVLADDGPDNVTLRQEALNLIKELDQKGIVQSIASKNEHDLVISFLKKHNLKQFFIYEQINWLPKSGNIKTIAKDFNLGLDSFVFIDDSPFEREEVKHHLPEIRIFDAAEIKDLGSRPEFDVPITEASKTRRQSYITESLRKRSQENYTSDYRGFLLNCQLELTVSNQFDATSTNRCFELLQRTNQLNLSGRRFDQESFQHLLKNSEVSCFHFSCGDTYGNYGLVGFAATKLQDEYLLITDFAMSCRVAQKKFENKFFQHLLDIAKAENKKGVLVDYIPTDRNQILLESLKTVGFTDFKNKGPTTTSLLLPLTSQIPDLDLVQLHVIDS